MKNTTTNNTNAVKLTAKAAAALAEQISAERNAHAAAVADNIGKRAYLERNAHAAADYAAAAVERKPDGKTAADAVRAAAKAAAALADFDTNAADTLNALDYAQYAINTNAAPLANIVDGLARIAAFGTLNKVFEKTGNKKIQRVKIELVKALNARDSLSELSNSGEQIAAKYNKRTGKAKQAEYGGDLSAAMLKYADAVSCDAMDIYNAAYLSLWENITAFQYSLFDYVPATLARGCGGVMKKDRTVFQTACAAARRAIEQNSGTAVDTSRRYVWYEQYSDESGTVDIERINRKFAVALSYDNGGIELTDTDGAESEYLRELYARLADTLSERENAILSLRLNGYSRNAIADKLNIQRGNVNTYIQRIAAKAKAIPSLADAIRAAGIE